jgi:hypothetical protein
VAEQPGLIGGNDAHAGTRARPAQRLDPLGELRGDLAVVLKVLEATSPVALAMLGRKKANRLGHALEAARREVRRALEATGAGSGSGSA